jgi:lipoprotein-anchoring transpeptidase ErfK/SrfK
MYRHILAVGFALPLLATLTQPITAQTWAPWYQPNLHEPSRLGRGGSKPKPQPPASSSGSASLFSFADPSSDDDDDDRAPRLGPALLQGGARPDIQPQAPSRINYVSQHAKGTIVVDTAARRLYIIQGPTSALAYPVSVGREGFTWTGTEKISRVAAWPDWHPPAEMRKRDPRLPVKMTGGVHNPLGAKALYLGATLYRIHGTSDARSIGRASSSGCFRMHNRHVVDLANRVGVGTRVVVIRASSPRTRTASAND